MPRITKEKETRRECGCADNKMISCGCADIESNPCGCSEFVLEFGSHDSCSDETEDKVSPGDIARLIIGAAFLALGVVLEKISVLNGYFLLPVFIPGYLLLGGGVLLRAAKNISRGEVFDENFLMTLATLGAFAIGVYAEAVAVMLFYRAGELLQESAVNNSKKKIASLMDLRPDRANLSAGGELTVVKPEQINIGDVIVVKPGEKIPLDGVVTDGASTLDTSSLTGESFPRGVSPGDAVLSGCVNLDGVLTVRVASSYGESTASKIIKLAMDAAEKKAPTESFIKKFARYYTPAVVVAATCVALLPPLLIGGAWSGWINRGLILLVVSCPCALVLSVPLGFFGGIGGASRRGILIKGGNHLETLARVDTVAFDKTGTLTEGSFAVRDIVPADGCDEAELLEAAAYAEAFSCHPIAKSVLRRYGKEIDVDALSEYQEVTGQGAGVVVNGRSITAGGVEFIKARGADPGSADPRETAVHVAADGAYIGRITFADGLKPDAREAVRKLKKLGVRRIALLTGDGQYNAEAVANELMIENFYGGLLPDKKAEMIYELKNSSGGGKKRNAGGVAFVGDGVNDAPALAAADVGVAMGGLGSDAAMEAADVVLMTDEPSKLAEAIATARFTKRIVTQNIIISLGVKILFMLLGALGYAELWEAVFADVGVALAAVINSTRALGGKRAP